MVANPGRVAYGPVLPEAGDAGDDELRVAGQQRVGLQAQPFEGAGPEVLDQHVGLVAQPVHELEVVGRLQVEGDRPLAAAAELPPQGDVVSRITPAHAAQRVAAIRAFDLDDIGAEVGEVASARRARDHRRRVDDLDIRERP